MAVPWPEWSEWDLDRLSNDSTIIPAFGEIINDSLSVFSTVGGNHLNTDLGRSVGRFLRLLGQTSTENRSGARFGVKAGLRELKRGFAPLLERFADSADCIQ